MSSCPLLSSGEKEGGVGKALSVESIECFLCEMFTIKKFCIVEIEPLQRNRLDLKDNFNKSQR